MQIPCVRCKGRLCHVYAPMFFGSKKCPVYERMLKTLRQVKKGLKQLQASNIQSLSLNTTSPSVFVSRFGYPKTSVGLLSTPEPKNNAWVYDNPRYWATKDFSIEHIARFRVELINSSFQTSVTVVRTSSKNKLLTTALEVAMAKKQTLVDLMLKSKPKTKIVLQPGVPPIALKASVLKAEVAENPKIPKKVEKAFYDYDLKAEQAIIDLSNFFDENYLSKLLSVGVLGFKPQRKLVPTRWAITAVDDMLAKNYYKHIKNYSQLDRFLLFKGQYQGNHFLVLFIPKALGFELFETYTPKSAWNLTKSFAFTTDYELLKPRTSYAENCTGGYYAARLAVLEKLKALKRKASVIALRFITPDYYLPLGVWVVREAVRKSLNTKPMGFNSLDKALLWIKSIALKEFKININKMLSNSKVLRFIKQQKRLIEF